MATVLFRVGDIFESGADLTVLPCSARGHISPTANLLVQQYGLSLPSDMKVGDVQLRESPVEVRQSVARPHCSRYYAWAASVINFRSEPEVIRIIGATIGLFANENRRLQIIEAPLLGSGAGRLDPVVAGPALRDGFLSTCTTDAVFLIYSQTAIIIERLRGLPVTNNPADYALSTNENTIRKPPKPHRANGQKHSGGPDSAVFISYSHKDKRFLDQLRTQLKPLERLGRFSIWSDRDIAAGCEWHAEITAALDASRVAVLLVSPEFLASNFISEHELAPALKRAAEGGLRVLWIPLRACNYQHSALSKYQAVHPPDKPLADLTPGRDQAWVEICQAILAAVEASA
jgi:hypothetical protein